MLFLHSSSGHSMVTFKPLTVFHSIQALSFFYYTYKCSTRECLNWNYLLPSKFSKNRDDKNAAIKQVKFHSPLVQTFDTTRSTYLMMLFIKYLHCVFLCCSHWFFTCFQLGDGLYSRAKTNKRIRNKSSFAFWSSRRQQAYCIEPVPIRN